MHFVVIEDRTVQIWSATHGWTLRAAPLAITKGNILVGRSKAAADEARFF
jgi:hypothetical protein